MLRSKKGFTLIELVLVIVILAILAAVAIPRFIDLREEARNSAAAGVTGALRGAITMLHAQYLLRNTQYNVGTITDTTGVLYNAGLQGVTIVDATTTPAQVLQLPLKLKYHLVQHIPGYIPMPPLVPAQQLGQPG